MDTLDEAIQKNKEELKNFLINYEEELNNNNFEIIYNTLNRYTYDTAASFTALLLKNNINPLLYMNKIPDIFAEKLDIKEFIIPNDITDICSCAFYMGGLKSITIPKSVTNIMGEAFNGCVNLTDVYYKGSEEDWNKIRIEWGNEYLLGASIHYNS